MQALAVACVTLLVPTNTLLVMGCSASQVIVLSMNLYTSLKLVGHRNSLSADHVEHRLFTIYWPDKTHDTCRIRVGVLLADLEEQWDLASLKHSGTNMVDMLYLIAREQITNFDRSLSEYEKRTEVKHKLALLLYQQLKGTAGEKQGQAALDAISMKPTKFVAIWDLNPEIDCYQLFAIDRLHQDFNGMTLHLIQALDQYLVDKVGPAAAGRIRGEINGRLHNLRGYHEAFYPSQGLDAKFVHAEERRGLMKFLPIVLRGLEHIPDDIVDVFAGIEHMHMQCIYLVYSAIVTLHSAHGR